jgi:hypothetical protein
MFMTLCLVKHGDNFTFTFTLQSAQLGLFCELAFYLFYETITLYNELLTWEAIAFEWHPQFFVFICSTWIDIQCLY